MRILYGTSPKAFLSFNNMCNTALDEANINKMTDTDINMGRAKDIEIHLR